MPIDFRKSVGSTPPALMMTASFSSASSSSVSFSRTLSGFDGEHLGAHQDLDLAGLRRRAQAFPVGGLDAVEGLRAIGQRHARAGDLR